VRNLPSPKTVKRIALLTAVTSIPLLLSFNIKYALFPQVSTGAALRFLCFVGLSVFCLAPALVLLGLVTTVRIWLSSEGSNTPSLGLELTSHFCSGPK
jgi:hypothetical protein